MVVAIASHKKQTPQLEYIHTTYGNSIEAEWDR